MTLRLKTLLTAVAAGAGTLVAGCVIGGRTIYHVDNPFLFLANAAAHGPIAIMVVGEPYPNRRDQVDAVVADAFDRTFKSLGNPFRAAEPAPGPISKIVVLFNATGSASAQSICADPTKVATGASGMRTSVRALYCGDGPYSEYSMSFFTPQSPEDETFVQLMAQLADLAIPREPNPTQKL